MKRFLRILQFMTRIPINMDLGFDDEFHKGMVFFPSVGAVLGILYFLTTYAALKIFGTYLGSLFFLLISVILTGGLHLDGLADTFDGIYSYRDKERILEIMKDSRIGANGLLAILFFVLAKLGVVNELFTRNLIFVAILCPIYGRTAIMMASYKNKTPRENGMGNVFIGKINANTLLIGLLTTLSYVVAVGLLFSLDRNFIVFNVFFIAVLWVFVRLYTRYITGFIDGITGDVLGCTCELSELLYLTYMYLGVFKWLG